jgi:hypothetical protein
MRLSMSRGNRTPSELPILATFSSTHVEAPL